MSKLDDPVWRHERAKKAGAGNRARHHAARMERGRRYQTKGHAFAAGYRLGYQKAMAWWRRKYQTEAA